MAAYLKLQSGTPVHAKIKEYTGTQEGQYGTQHVWDLIVNGDCILWTTSSEKAHKEMLAHGKGSWVTIEKIFKNGKNFINIYPYFPEGEAKAQPREQRVVPMNEPDYSLDPQAQPDMREVKMGRGACYNLAFQYVVMREHTLTMGSAFLDKVSEIASLIEGEQRKFINKL